MVCTDKRRLFVSLFETKRFQWCEPYRRTHFQGSRALTCLVCRHTIAELESWYTRTPANHARPNDFALSRYR
jgi:hypothetical protein